jgi:glycosyltransferase involved in cell wall biosynthesis
MMNVATLVKKAQDHFHYSRNRAGLQRVISLKPQGPSLGNVLLSYILEPFCLPPGQEIPYTHSNYWESFQIAKTFLECNYAVDVISFQNHIFTPRKSYAFIVDPRHNLQRLAPLLPDECIKIFHIDVAHTLFNSTAELNRLLALQQRRGVTLSLRRFERPNLGIEYADCATMIGNDFTLYTFKYANKPIYKVPMPSTFLYEWLDSRDFETCRNRFLWLGSYGLVHKGLDLVLEAFAALPSYHLTVCGPIQNEPDFEAAFYKELYQTPNIHTVGWVDVRSQEFLNIVKSCVGCVYASASEGQSGSVVTCLHAGLIPIISYECGVDISHGAGIVMADCSVETIQKSVQSIASLPANELQHMARANWEYARAHYTREKYAEVYSGIVKKLCSSH